MRIASGITIGLFAIALAGCCAADARRVSPPRASTAEEQEVARRRYAEAQRAFAAGRYRTAVALFERADRVIADPSFAYNLSLAYEALGDPAHALWWSREYLRRDPSAADKREVIASIRAHERRLAQAGVQQVTVSSSPSGAAVAVDGEAVGVTPWVGLLAPGTHIVDLDSAGRPRERRAFQLQTERSLDLHVDFAPAR